MNNAHRRRFTLGLAVAASAFVFAPFAARSQPAGRTLRLAILDYAPESARHQNWQIFRARLRELGYVEGKNLLIEARYARGANEKLPALAAELLAAKPDVIVTAATPAAQAVIKATSSIPIVFTSVADPIAAGLVKSFGRPGGNATGVALITTEIGPKWLELLRELAPSAKRVAYLTDTGSEAAVLVFKRMQAHAGELGVAIEMFPGQQPKDLERSLETIVRERFAGLVVGASARLSDHRTQIVQFAARQKLPAVYAVRAYADAGGLVAYGPDVRYLYRRTADYVHRIAQGAKPAETPVERPDTVRMVLNLKTARALGIAVPPAIRHRADELID